jgi:2-polyprenyl-3-methyl-5-hydroxy-6-metoxy-1,4-benzoquinol methylase
MLSTKNLSKSQSLNSCECAVPRSEIDEFIQTEKLAYQGINLPFGLKTPGNDRAEAKAVAFSSLNPGDHILDIGSFLGAFCLEALERGASRAVGLELNHDRIRQAKKLAKFKKLNPTYIRADIEEWESEDNFDLVLCLNVIHHLRDPAATLRKLALLTKSTLLLEVATFGGHDGKKLAFSSTANRRKSIISKLKSKLQLGPLQFLLSKLPVAYIGPFSPSQHYQTYFFSEPALRNILDGHMRLFHRIETIPSTFKGRFFLRCMRLKIQKLIVVAGVCSSGKSTICQAIQNNAFKDQLAISDCSEAHVVTSPSLWRQSTELSFPKNNEPLVILKYDITSAYRYRIHSFWRDPATDIFSCADDIEFIIVAPSPETLQQQLVTKYGLLRGHQKDYAEKYDQPGWLESMYSDWLAFTLAISQRKKGRFYIVEKQAAQGSWTLRGLKPEAIEEQLSRVYAPFSRG